MTTSETNTTVEQLTNRAMQGTAQLRERLQCHVLLSRLQAIQRRLAHAEAPGHRRLGQASLAPQSLENLR